MRGKELGVVQSVSFAVCGQEGHEIAADTFPGLRARWGVTNGQLLAQWGDPQTLSVHRSSGKGGAFFVSSSKSPTQLIKSISRAETRWLRDLARPYAAHVVEGPSLLCRVLGCFVAASGTAVVLLENVLAGSPPLPAPVARFDLKGALEGRRAAPGASTLLDCDWIDTGRGVVLAAEARAALLAQVERDANFLRRHELMDYSLLLGVCERPEDWSRAELAAAAASCGPRAVVSADGESVYLVGIIDFLQVYNLKKKAAHAYKAAVKDAALISTVAPEDYAARFVGFMRNRVFEEAVPDDALV